MINAEIQNAAMKTFSGLMTDALTTFAININPELLIKCIEAKQANLNKSFFQIFDQQMEGEDLSILDKSVLGKTNQEILQLINHFIKSQIDFIKKETQPDET